MTTAVRLQLLSRPDCHLCDEMATALRDLGLPFDRVNIADNPALEAEYGTAIPVLFHKDAEVARAPQSSRTLKRALQRAGVL